MTDKNVSNISLWPDDEDDFQPCIANNRSDPFKIGKLKYW